jgi:hypothetical protein
MTNRVPTARGGPTGSRLGPAFMIVVDFSEIEEKSTTITGLPAGRARERPDRGVAALVSDRIGAGSRRVAP